jgi:hypothetical protein
VRGALQQGGEATSSGRRARLNIPVNRLSDERRNLRETVSRYSTPSAANRVLITVWTVMMADPFQSVITSDLRNGGSVS